MTRSAVLLLGPTGSGKTPLGQLLEIRGLWARRCVHFDFGENLRCVVLQDRIDSRLSRVDIEFLKGVLQSGALLEDQHFPIAQRLLQSFLDEHGADADTIVVLNGLPRHTGQAEALGGVLNVKAVVHLQCSAETVLERIGSNVGGDRTDRGDDGLAMVRAKLAIFAARTSPLVDYYCRRRTHVVSIDVTSQTTADEMWRRIEACRITGSRSGDDQPQPSDARP